MPGSDVCGRCGTSLSLATATLDVHPPRAGRMAKRLRRVAPLRRAYYGAANTNLATRAASTVRQVTRAVPPQPTIVRLLVPGWSHFYLGQRWRGHLFFWGFLAFLLPGLAAIGTAGASICLGLAFTVHSSAALDIVTLAFPYDNLRQRMGRSIATSIALGLLIYLPAGRLLTRIADPHAIEEFDAPFAEGDVVLVNQLAKPAVGRVVLYDIAEFTFDHPGAGHQRYVRITGERIDRIVAGPGDDVLWEDGALRVNGANSPLHPLAPLRLTKPMSFHVPADCFLILPSTTRYIPDEDDPYMWHRLSFVPRTSIHGRVYARSHPLTRLRWFH